MESEIEQTRTQSKRKRLGCTCMRLRKATRRVSQIYDRSLEAAGMTVTQYGLLGQLARFDGIGIGALAEKLIMDPTTLTRNLRPLERQGFVSMKADRRDKRSRCLHLTASGPCSLRARRACLGAGPASGREGARRSRRPRR